MFNKFAIKVTELAGKPVGFLLAFMLVIGWAIAGPFFNFSQGWQIIINTATTIITFLMVFVIQYSQNKDTVAIHLKLDELIKATSGARDETAGIEEKSVKEIKEMKA
jgi:low affinity Fe/Cu permease